MSKRSSSSVAFSSLVTRAGSNAFKRPLRQLRATAKSSRPTKFSVAVSPRNVPLEERLPPKPLPLDQEIVPSSSSLESWYWATAFLNRMLTCSSPSRLPSIKPSTESPLTLTLKRLPSKPASSVVPGAIKPKLAVPSTALALTSGRSSVPVADPENFAGAKSNLESPAKAALRFGYN